ncbi:MAG: GAF domain-containing protein, partial [Armatimonadetes bacterium]|nr:GAF domain-containing protein [Anaerolineae bacterium]
VSDDGDLSLVRAALLRHVLPEEGVFIGDLAAISAPDALERDLQIAAGDRFRAVGAVNLRVKDSAGGVLLMGYTEPHRFTEAEMRYMTALSDSTSVVLDNLVLVEEIQSTLQETTVLYQAGRNLFNAATPQEILDVVINFLIEPHVDQAFVAMLNGREWMVASAEVMLEATWNPAGTIDLQRVVLSALQFPAWKQLATPTLLTIDDIENDDSMDEMQRLGLQSLDARSVLIVPLRVPNRSIGALWVSSTQPHTFTTREMRIYQSFGEQASLSMQAAYLLSQTERRARQLQTSAEIASSAGNILDLQTLLPQVVDLIKGAFNYDHVQVFLMDETDQVAYVRASTGEAGKQLLAINHKLRKGSESVIGQVTATGRPSIALDTADTTVVHKPNPYLPNTRSEMALPLIIKNQVIGALDVQSNQANFFTEDDIAVLTTLAAQISIAIENARLYAEANTQAERMQFLFDVTTAAASAATLGETLEKLAYDLQASQEALVVALYLRRDYVDVFENAHSILQAVALAGTNQPLSEVEAPRLTDPTRLLSRLARNQQPAIVEDTQNETSYLPVMDQARAAIITPMVTGGELLGMIVMESAQPNAYDTDDLQMLQALSGSVSAIIQSAQLLDRLTSANKELRELDRIKSDFLANMSHELRTPLNSIIGFSRVMLKGIDGPLTEMQEQDLTTIYNSGQHLLGLINDVLDQAKIAAGKMDLKLAYFDVKPLVEGVKSIGLGLIKDKPIQLLM